MNMLACGAYNVPLPALVFVYGTLKRGYGNNRLLTTSEFIDVRHTTHDHVMLGMGIPFVRAMEAHDPDEMIGKVEGELWKVDSHSVLQQLDALEGHPTGYTRTRIILDCGTSAWIYYYHHTFRSHNYVRPDNEGIIRYAR